jgi:hypothetical protein
MISWRILVSCRGFFWRLYFCLLKDLNFHNSSFAFKILFNVNGKVTVWHTPCLKKKKKKKRWLVKANFAAPYGRTLSNQNWQQHQQWKGFRKSLFFFLGILEVTMNGEPGFTNVNSFVVRRKSTLHTKTSIWKFKKKKKKKNQGVCYTVALPFTLEGYLKANEELWKLKSFSMQKYNLQKILLKKPKSFEIFITL